MTKVKCKVCSNEVDGVCSVKKVGVKLNKKRTCEKYIYDETKVKEKVKIPVTRVGYVKQQKIKEQLKLERKQLMAELKRQVQDKTARDLGLIKPTSKIITPDSINLSNPLTGDLSRFKTTATEE